MSRLLQISKVKLQKEPGKNKIKRASFEGFPDSVRMGIHGGIAEFFGITPDEPMPSTLDYIVAAVGGCLTGTVAGAAGRRFGVCILTAAVRDGLRLSVRLPWRPSIADRMQT